MTSQPKQWPQAHTDWPANNSNAAHDRDQAALSAAEIRHLARSALRDLDAGRQLPRDQLRYLFARIAGSSADILRLMERNGAPKTPF